MCMYAMLHNFLLSFHVTRPLPTLRALTLKSNTSYILSSASHHTTSKDNCSSSTSASAGVTPARALREPYTGPPPGVLFLPNSGNSSHMSSYGGPSPAQQPLVAQFMGVHQPIVGASGTDIKIMESEPMPMACILSVSVAKGWHVTKKSMQEIICCSSPAPSPVLL